MSWFTDLLTGIGMTGRDIAQMGPDEKRLLRKALPKDTTPEEMAELADDEDAMAALDDGDEQEFVSVTSRFFKSKRKPMADDDDESDEDDDGDGDDGDDDEDDDVTDEDVKKAASDLWDDEDDETVGPKKAKGGKCKGKPVKKAVRKSLSDCVDDEAEDDDDLRDVIDGNAVIGKFIKSYDAHQKQRDRLIFSNLAEIAKSVRELEASMGQAGRLPAGRALPSKARKGPLDGDIGPDIDKVEKSVFALQEAGQLDAGDALGILDAANRGGKVWEHWKGVLAEAEAGATATDDGD